MTESEARLWHALTLAMIASAGLGNLFVSQRQHATTERHLHQVMNEVSMVVDVHQRDADAIAELRKMLSKP
jgi:hypothetical protein